MTTIEVIRALLLADSTVAGLVGTRVFPQVAPQGSVPPRAVVSCISDVPVNSLDGTAETRALTIRVQVDCYATTYLAAHGLATAVSNVIANLSRPDISAARANAQDAYEDDTQLHRVSMDFMVSR